MSVIFSLIAKRVLSEPAVITLSILLFLFTSAGMVAVYWRWTRTDRTSAEAQALRLEAAKVHADTSAVILGSASGIGCH